MVVLFPLQTEAKVAAAVPPTLVAFTETEVTVLETAAQAPLVTSAL
jgi:hypothetical protein